LQGVNKTYPPEYPADIVFESPNVVKSIHDPEITEEKTVVFSGIPRIRLVENETPLQRVPNLGAYLGRDDIFIKREDMMPIAMGGNKLRSLEFWLGEALSLGCDIVITAGMKQSNHCRLTAAACKLVGLDCLILHNSEQDDEFEGNTLLNDLMGAKRVFLGNITEQERGIRQREWKEKLIAEGRHPYLIEDYAVGALGYVSCGIELMQQVISRRIDLRHVFISASAGPTEAGLLFGLAMFGPRIKVHLISVEYEREYYMSEVRSLFSKIGEKLGFMPPVGVDDIAVFYDEYLGEGYGIPTEPSLDAVRIMAEKEAIMIETTYNAKTYAGMFDLMRKGVIPRDEAVCCFLTGGTPYLFSSYKSFKKGTAK